MPSFKAPSGETTASRIKSLYAYVQNVHGRAEADAHVGHAEAAARYHHLLRLDEELDFAGRDDLRIELGDQRAEDLGAGQLEPALTHLHKALARKAKANNSNLSSEIRAAVNAYLAGVTAEGTRLGDSILVNGACLTVTAVDGDAFFFSTGSGQMSISRTMRGV